MKLGMVTAGVIPWEKVREIDERSRADDRHLELFVDPDPTHATWLEYARIYQTVRLEDAQGAYAEAVAAHAKLDAAVAGLHEACALSQDAQRLVERGR